MTDLDAFASLVRARRTSLVVDAEREVPAELVEQLVELATWAPNHKRTWPWQFAVCTGAARARLGEAFAQDMVAAGREPGDSKVTKARTKFLRCPTVLVIGCDPSDAPQVARENRDAVAAGIQNLLLGATAAGLASFWASPPTPECPTVRELCGFDPDVTVMALVYLGWPTGEVATPERPAPTITDVDPAR